MNRKIPMFCIVLGALACSGTPSFDGDITATAPVTFDNLGAVSAFDQEIQSNDADNSSPTGFTFDITDIGTIDDGFNDDNDDSFDGGSEFTFLSGDTFDAAAEFPSRADNHASQAYLEDVDGDGTEDQVVLVAKSDGGLNVIRKIYVFPTFDCGSDASACGLTRYLDCITNNTGENVNVFPQIHTNLGSDGSGELKGSAVDTDSLSDPFYFACKDSDDPSVGYIIGAEGASVTPSADTDPSGSDLCTENDFVFNWGGQFIRDGDRACFMHYVVLGNGYHDNDTTDNPSSDVMALVRGVYGDTPRTGISFSEDQDIRNFEPGIFTVLGAESSVPDSATVIVTNKDTSESVEVTAASDGSFQAALDCTGGDVISITAPDSKDREVTCE